mmetsp:Transcript_67984/g.160028  ORF Transcript_67984/g.160028 Transcript_67984/m.160028 type:complete len:242 (-) Transcript_67984:1373-2098(-)
MLVDGEVYPSAVRELLAGMAGLGVPQTALEANGHLLQKRVPIPVEYAGDRAGQPPAARQIRPPREAQQRHARPGAKALPAIGFPHAVQGKQGQEPKRDKACDEAEESNMPEGGIHAILCQLVVVEIGEEQVSQEPYAQAGAEQIRSCYHPWPGTVLTQGGNKVVGGPKQKDHKHEIPPLELIQLRELVPSLTKISSQLVGCASASQGIESSAIDFACHIIPGEARNHEERMVSRYPPSQGR